MPSINDRLTYDILSELTDGSKRFRDLLNYAPKATLAIRLRELERKSYLKRKVLNTRPIATEYSITNEGKRFLENVQQQYVLIMRENISKITKQAMPKVQ